MHQQTEQNQSLTPDGDDGKDDPSSPVREVLDEDQSHQSADHNEISLLQTQWTLPMYADHTDDAKVPHQQGYCDVVHWNVVRQQHLTGTSHTCVWCE